MQNEMGENNVLYATLCGIVCAFKVSSPLCSMSDVEKKKMNKMERNVNYLAV